MAIITDSNYSWFMIGDAVQAPTTKTTTTTALPIPEYLLGLPVLAILGLLALIKFDLLDAVFKRRTRN